jgi:hypothetical protein
MGMDTRRGPSRATETLGTILRIRAQGDSPSNPVCQTTGRTHGESRTCFICVVAAFAAVPATCVATNQGTLIIAPCVSLAGFLAGWCYAINPKDDVVTSAIILTSAVIAVTSEAGLIHPRARPLFGKQELRTSNSHANGNCILSI